MMDEMETVDEREIPSQKVEWLKHSFVAEWPQVSSIIGELRPDTPDSDFIRVQLILGKYQEQAQLLDQHMEAFMHTMTSKVLEVAQSDAKMSRPELVLFLLQCLSLVYVMSKVRGYKAILKYFPHEVERVSTLERLLNHFRDNNRMLMLYEVKRTRNAMPQSSDFTTVSTCTRSGAVQNFADQLIFDSFPWHGEYITSLWLSVAILIPFHLSIVDTETIDGEAGAVAGLGERVRTWCQEGFLTACQDGSPTIISCSLLLARLLSRPDLKGEIPLFLEWAGKHLASHADDSVKTTSSQKLRVLTAMAAVLKRVPRESLLEHSDLLRRLLDMTAPLASGGAKQRRAALKSLGRLALVYLPPRPVQFWHYKKTTRSLLENLRSQSDTATYDYDGDVDVEDDDDLEEDAEEVAEEIIGYLINAICDTDTQVRYCAARQLSYIALRLPREFAEQVVDMVLSLFSPTQDDGAWHGASLALAEMGRRGLLLPSKLERAIDGVLQALQYDEKHGKTSKGAHVRDAACYVAWAFARAFDPKCMEANIPKIARGLVVLSLLDREVNCRRAAAAALQEHVGRQGGPMCENLPNAIDIITIADYFSLGSRRNAYINVAPQVAMFPQYLPPIVDHLVERKVSHWDRQVRYLAAEALGRLADVDAKYFASKALSDLLSRVYSDDTDERHGCILAVGEVVLAIYRSGNELEDDTKRKVLDVVPILDGKRLFRGRGAEQVRDSACNLIYCISKAGLVLKGHPMPSTGRAPMAKKPKSLMILMQSLLDENLKHSNEEIQFSAVRALRAFSEAYHNVTPTSAPILARWVAAYCKGIDTELNVAVRRGFALALGALQSAVLEQELEAILSCLVRATTIPSHPELKTDAETRRNAVEALLEIVSKVPLEKLGRENAHKVFRATVKALGDYSFDRRGDVGSWVRSSAMLSLGLLTAQFVRFDSLSPSAARENDLLFTEKMGKLLVSVLLKQAVEKIDRVRDIACHVLTHVIRLGDEEYVSDQKRVPLIGYLEQQRRQGVRYLPLSSRESQEERERERELERCTPIIPFIPHRDELMKVFKKDSWFLSEKSTTFDSLVPLLRFDTFRHYLLSGVSSSIGGLSKAVNTDSYAALLRFTRTLCASEAAGMANALAEVGKSGRGNDVVMMPFFKTVARLLSDRCFMDLQPPENTFSVILAHLVRVEVRSSKDVLKLECSIPLLVGLLAFQDPTRQLSIECIVSLLSHRFPKVRKFAAEQFYVACLSYDDLLSPEEAALVPSVLVETVWEDLTAARREATKVMDILGITKKEKASEENDEM